MDISIKQTNLTKTTHLVLLPFISFLIKCDVPIHVGHKNIKWDSSLLIIGYNVL